MKVLISGVGGPTPRSIARSLKKSSFSDCQLVGTDSNPLAHGLYDSALYSSTHLIPSANEPGYWDALFELVRTEQFDFAMVHPEQEVIAWSKRKHEGKELPCDSLIPDYPLVEVLLSKSKMTKVLEDTPWVPRSYSFFRDRLDFKQLEQVLNYPFWVRASSGSSGLGSLQVYSKDELENWIDINPKVEEFIASTFLPGRNLACKLLYYNGELVRSASGERVNYIMSKVAPSGITGNTSFGRLLNEPNLVEVATQVMDKLFEATQSHKHGFFTVDFKEDAYGTPYITEVNVRMVAFNYSFAMAGANFSEAIISLLSHDSSFDTSYQMYQFKEGQIFLRDVDAEPILMLESDLKKVEFLKGLSVGLQSY